MTPVPPAGAPPHPARDATPAAPTPMLPMAMTPTRSITPRTRPPRGRADGPDPRAAHTRGTARYGATVVASVSVAPGRS